MEWMVWGRCSAHVDSEVTWDQVGEEGPLPLGMRKWSGLGWVVGEGSII